MNRPPEWLEWPYARIRRHLETDKGEITRFVAQLEYNLNATPTGENDPEWRTVARFDHGAHDIDEEGLHLDIYKDGEKHKVRDNFPPVPLDNAPEFCVAFFKRNEERLLERFERWHNLHGPWRV